MEKIALLVMLTILCWSSGCKNQTLYGWVCDKPCPSTCLNSKCYRSTGNCKNGCKNGFYGSKCNMTCSYGCRHASCKKSDGSCLLGCKQGYDGRKCAKQCPANCLYSSCKRSGYCTRGCKNGFYGNKCETECPKRCLLVSCRRFTGYCLNGCKHGFYGKKCELSCQGTDCSTLKDETILESCLDLCRRSKTIYSLHKVNSTAAVNEKDGVSFWSYVAAGFAVLSVAILIVTICVAVNWKRSNTENKQSNLSRKSVHLYEFLRRKRRRKVGINTEDKELNVMAKDDNNASHGSYINMTGRVPGAYVNIAWSPALHNNRHGTRQ